MATIRERRPEDLQGCAEALKAVYKASGYPVRGVDDPVGFISNPNTIQAYVAEFQGRIVGHVVVSQASIDAEYVKLWSEQSSDEIAALERLFVHPEAQGMGIAGKLMKTAVEYAADNLSMRLVLFNLEKDTIARRMYGKLGWTFYANFIFSWDENSMKAYCFVSPALVSFEESVRTELDARYEDRCTKDTKYTLV